MVPSSWPDMHDQGDHARAQHDSQACVHHSPFTTPAIQAQAWPVWGKRVLHLEADDVPEGMVHRPSGPQAGRSRASSQVPHQHLRSAL